MQQLGLEYAQKNFPGHQTLVCTHTDGHNKSGNIHVHIVLNSLRKYDVERQNFMERPYDSCAGRRGQETMDKCNRKMQARGITPRNTKFQTEKEYLRNSIDQVASSVLMILSSVTELLLFPVTNLLMFVSTIVFR